jgi:hypothetical protein
MTTQTRAKGNGMISSNNNSYMSFTEASDSDTSIVESNRSICDGTGDVKDNFSNISASYNLKAELEFFNPNEVKPQYYYHPYAER